MKRIYISGRVTGEPLAEVTMKFGTAQKKLESEGYTVLNPLELVSGKLPEWPNVRWEDAMKICISALMSTNEIYMLWDYASSAGALLEHRIAQDLNYKIRYQ